MPADMSIFNLLSPRRSGIQLLINFRSYSAFLIVLGLIQTNLLPLSLTPHWLPLFEPVTIGRHHIIVIVHFLIFIVVFVVLQEQDAGIVEIARWSLPCLMAGVVEMTRRGERDAERKLERLEGLTYAMKGP